MIETKTVEGKCPICETAVPFFTITINIDGWWRPKVQMTIDADATDYVAHMWTHRL